MLFNSISFVLFFIVTGLLYYALPHRFRWFWLLAAGFYFYMVFIPAYVLVLVFLIGVDYVLGRQIEDMENGAKKKTLLILSIGANIGTLFIFKYFNFFNQNLSELAQVLHWNYPIPALQFILPLGVPFHVFQSLSYIIEVYRGNQKAERHLGIYALYVMFFPQLVAGPIERPQNLLHQFHEAHPFNGQQVLDGLKLMLRGFFKKIVIADRLALLVNHVYGNVSDSNGLVLGIATIAFAIQIYCDFSGYSDIALGSAQVLGYQLMKNFNQPYFATSISDFWRRWHISLSSWFRDYVYIPLGGNQVSTFRKYLNILIVFLLSGLWHGANWTFVVWGAWHGTLLILSDVTRKIRSSFISTLNLVDRPWLHRSIQIIITNLLVSFGWIFFRAKDFTEALDIIQRIFSSLFHVLRPDFFQSNLINESMLGLALFPLSIVLISIFLMLALEPLQKIGWVQKYTERLPSWLRASRYYLAIFWILFFGYVGESTFIYFQF